MDLRKNGPGRDGGLDWITDGASVQPLTVFRLESVSSLLRLMPGDAFSICSQAPGARTRAGALSFGDGSEPRRGWEARLGGITSG